MRAHTVRDAFVAADELAKPGGAQETKERCLPELIPDSTRLRFEFIH